MGARFIRETDKLVSDKTKICCIDQKDNNELYFSGISQCAKALKLNQATVKQCLLTGSTWPASGKKL